VPDIMRIIALAGIGTSYEREHILHPAERVVPSFS